MCVCVDAQRSETGARVAAATHKPTYRHTRARIQTLALTSAVSTDLSGYFVPFVVGWGAIIALFVPIITLSLNPIDIIAKVRLEARKHIDRGVDPAKLTPALPPLHPTSVHGRRGVSQ